MEFQVFLTSTALFKYFSRLRLKEASGKLQLVAVQERFYRSAPASMKPCRRLGRLVGSHYAVCFRSSVGARYFGDWRPRTLPCAFNFSFRLQMPSWQRTWSHILLLSTARCQKAVVVNSSP
ncbi:unnamed protein product [Polarella glacialis]|uniref:Uncharacterized protein n=1 Tax=Polarella glacialis TaxID=89957 RepID=A0A813J5L9_POLGL|nr:unnamed protein product [Polarella glacialis]